MCVWVCGILNVGRVPIDQVPENRGTGQLFLGLQRKKRARSRCSYSNAAPLRNRVRATATTTGFLDPARLAQERRLHSIHLASRTQAQVPIRVWCSTDSAEIPTNSPC